MVKNLPVSAGDMNSVAGLGRSPGEGNGNPFQYSCLGNPMDGEASQAFRDLERIGHDLATEQQQL